MDPIPIIFAALALGFLVLIILAIRKMAAGPAEDDSESKDAAGKAETTKTDGKKPPAKVEVAKKPPAKVEARKPPAVDTAEEKKRLKKGLAKTKGGFIARLSTLFSSKARLDEEVIEEVEEILFTADIGVQTSEELVESLRQRLGKGEADDPDAIWSHIKARAREMLAQQDARPLDTTSHKPFVILVVGVNGTGKTTTIGKISLRLKDEGHNVMLAGADTFRAAAVEQLEVWGERSGCPVVKGKEGADPSSVVVTALKRAKEEEVDVLIADTAGRLHTKVELMEELQKVGRSMDKWVDGAPHEVLLVLDSTMGQNAIAQARLFKEAMDVTGLVLTKLDGTAKGGVVLGICNELKLPVRFIGIGEKIEDLRVFDPEAFVDVLFEGAAEAGEAAESQ